MFNYDIEMEHLMKLTYEELFEEINNKSFHIQEIAFNEYEVAEHIRKGIPLTSAEKVILNEDKESDAAILVADELLLGEYALDFLQEQFITPEMREA